MRCYICDNELSENEVKLGPTGKSEPCTQCMNVIIETAFSDGFEIEPKDEEIEEIDDENLPVVD